jgi:serine/threonine protein kinase
MGEVYRARDTRLDRTVAIKVLPSHLSRDPAFRQRFEREARAISSLSHPNICTLYDIGNQDGVDYLVMEHLEGETLAARLREGPLGTGEAMRCAVQVADALDKAHRQGVVHRDLKPGNIMLTKSGAKLLDFGLAKHMAPSAGPPGMTASHTVTTPLTTQGTIVGTFQYMAPEQLEGKETDARSDLFAFGAVLYEMATGRKAFEGKTQAGLIGAILHTEPPLISAVVPISPPALDRLVRACLAKDPEERIQTAHDVKLQLQWILDAGSQPSAPAPAASARPFTRGRLGWVVAGLCAALMAAGWWLALARLRDGPAAAPEIRFSIQPPPDHSFTGESDTGFAVSPDGSRIVFVAEDGSHSSSLWARVFSSLAAQPLAGTEGADSPFFSPDGRAVGFFSEGRIKKIALSGGAPQVLCDLGENGGNVRGGAWSANGVILFGLGAGPLQRVADTGGKPSPALKLDASREEIAQGWPMFLPDGRRFLYHSSDTRRLEDRAIFIGSLDSDVVVRITDSPFKASYLASGYILFPRGGSLLAQRLRLDPPGLEGETQVVSEDLATAIVPGLAGFTGSSSGVVAYRPARGPRPTQLSWLDRGGRRLADIAPAATDISVSLSPDGTKAAVARSGGRSSVSAGGDPPANIWILDLQRGISSRLTLDASDSDENPVWSPDGSRIVFASHHRGGLAEVYEKSSRGTGEATLVLSSSENVHPIDWSPDGGRILLEVADTNGRMHLSILPLSGDKKPVPFTQSRFNEGQGQFSPDGRLIAYTSNESGAQEIYVRSLSSPEEKWQVSAHGGAAPRWRADGRELYYIDGEGTLMSVAAKLSPRFEAATPTPLFKTRVPSTDFWFYGGAANYAVSADGQRILVNNVTSEETSLPINVILNWAPPREPR